MTEFTKDTTIREMYGPAMEITDQGEANAYFEKCVEHVLSFSELNREDAEAQERANLAYYAGYGDSEIRERVERLFRAAHPVFGPIAVVEPPTMEEAFEMGKNAGRKVLERSE